MVSDLWGCGYFKKTFNRDHFKGSPDPSHFISEINVGKSRIRHKTTLNLNYIIFNWLRVGQGFQFQSRSMSNPTLSDIDFKNKLAWVWSTLKYVWIPTGDKLLNVKLWTISLRSRVNGRWSTGCRSSRTAATAQPISTSGECCWHDILLNDSF